MDNELRSLLSSYVASRIGRGADPSGIADAKRAVSLVDLLASRAAPLPHFCCPIADGGIQLEWQIGVFDVDVELTCGNMKVFVCDPENPLDDPFTVTLQTLVSVVTLLVLVERLAELERYIAGLPEWLAKGGVGRAYRMHATDLRAKLKKGVVDD